MKFEVCYEIPTGSGLKTVHLEAHNITVALIKARRKYQYPILYIAVL